jgi:hypothetical protein
MSKKTTSIKLVEKEIDKNFLVAAAEAEELMTKLYNEHPDLANTDTSIQGTGSRKFRVNEPWIQTYTGRRFTPTNPVVDAIVVEDIAHPLSMQCRFSGHVKSFYSVAQHSVLVSYICDTADALWGLLHDASEAYLVDIPRPIKQSGKFDNYLEFEKTMQKAICERFGLPEEMPKSVKMADDALLMTEARDLMSPLHPGWTSVGKPLPFVIYSMTQSEAKRAFIDRFIELVGPDCRDKYF